MQLKSVRLVNFRLFEDECFEFKPLTILTGPNSSGKSTVVKALLLLQENLKSPNFLGRLTFNKGKHQLGKFSSILRQNTKDENITFILNYVFPSTDGDRKNDHSILKGVSECRLTYTFCQDKGKQKENGLLTDYKIDFFFSGEWITFLDCSEKEEQISLSLNLDWLIEFQPNLLDIPIDSGVLKNRIPGDRLRQFLNDQRKILEKEKEEKIVELEQGLIEINEIKQILEEIERCNEEKNLIETNADEIFRNKFKKLEIDHDKNKKELERRLEKYKSDLEEINLKINVQEKDGNDTLELELQYESKENEIDEIKQKIDEFDDNLIAEKQALIEANTNPIYERIEFLEGNQSKLNQKRRTEIEDRYDNLIKAVNENNLGAVAICPQRGIIKR